MKLLKIRQECELTMHSQDKEIQWYIDSILDVQNT
jgi:hypothetical protein